MSKPFHVIVIVSDPQITAWDCNKTYKMTHAPSENLDQVGHLISLSSLWALRIAKDQTLLHADSRDWSVWVDAQVDQSLRFGHILFCWFCHALAQILMLKLALLSARGEPATDIPTYVHATTHGLHLPRYVKHQHVPTWPGPQILLNSSDSGHLCASRKTVHLLLRI